MDAFGFGVYAPGQDPVNGDLLAPGKADERLTR